MSIKTDSLYFNIMSDFAEGFANTSYYAFGSSLRDEDVSTNSEITSKKFLEKTIFGKKILSNEVRLLINKNFWTSKVYDQYDDTKDLTQLDFYTISKPDSFSGVYYVFKCLSNNYGAVSTTKPVYNDDISLNNYILMTPDGYIWKCMYDVVDRRYKTYSTDKFFPVFDDPDIRQDAKRGIDLIIVENRTTNNGYRHAEGTINSIDKNVGGYKRIILNSEDYQSSNDFYSGYTFYTTSPNGVTSKHYEVKASGVSDSRLYIDIDGYTSGEITNPQVNVWDFSLLPTIEIIGDGTGAFAIPTIVDRSIQSIKMLSTGENYTRALARVRKPLRGFNSDSSGSSDVSCILRAVVGPYGSASSAGGHGRHPGRELCARNIIISTEISSVIDAEIPGSNTYSKIGIVRTPDFSISDPLAFDNRIIVELSSTSLLNVGDIVTQTNTHFRGVIHSIDTINNKIYVTEYFGPYFDQTEEIDFYMSNVTPLSLSYQLSTPIGRIDMVDIVYPVYEQSTGQVLYISDFDPVTRTDDVSEQFKFILEF